MAQGTLKKPARANKPASKNKPQPPKKGARVIKSKKGSTADKIQRKMAAGIAAKTERLLGERAGHLELIGKGKKARGEDKDSKDKPKGGSKNPFGARRTSANGIHTIEMEFPDAKKAEDVRKG
ncbi:hypothetical protein F4810DRAFT_706868 [Camillea tinctor]|nr:hypothetical protein F4810DRAFT_706868 [Camillea tinctor]